ncbi:MAG: RDD family protein [Methylophilaceae bacterium]|nr:RDD family protein [Methylophilaceae bacterium]MBL6790621.1 RDD family protein [Methylophilaceae bacterium]
MQPTPFKYLMSFFYDIIIQLGIWLTISPLLLFVIEDNYEYKTILYQLSYWIISGFYYIFSWVRGGQTIGMKAWRLQLLVGTKNIHFFVLRYLLASAGLFFFAIGYIPIIFRDRPFHDKILGSKIIYVQSE